MKAWHFVGDELRDGRPVPEDGEKLVHEGALELCRSGLHASVKVLDALCYAPGNVLCRVDVGGKIIQDRDKLVASERTILWRIDAEPVLRHFTRLCALDVIHLWDAPDVAVRYLRTGDESLRDAAWDAAWDAMQDVEQVRTARWAVLVTVLAVARNTTYGAAWDAAWEVVRNWDGALERAAVREKQNRRLTRMVHEVHRKGVKS